MAKVKTVTFVPIENADAVREAFGVAGAGHIGDYSYCSYTVVGKDRFIPSRDAHPLIDEDDL